MTLRLLHSSFILVNDIIYPGGGGHSDTEGGRTRITYFAEEGVFF